MKNFVFRDFVVDFLENCSLVTELFNDNTDDINNDNDNYIDNNNCDDGYTHDSLQHCFGYNTDHCWTPDGNRWMVI